MSFIDAVIEQLAPHWAASRAEARLKLKALEKVRSQYDGARRGRRTDGWMGISTDANSELRSGALGRLRDNSRELVRNNSYARRAVDGIATNVIGVGIRPRFTGETDQATDELRQLGAEHFDSTDIDIHGCQTLAGLQEQIMRAVVESGEVIVRRRWRRLSDGYALPFQLEILEPDYLDESKDGDLTNGGRIVQGVEFNAIGRRVAYHLFREHPGSRSTYRYPASRRVPAEDVAHVYRVDRPGLVRGVPWLAPVMMRLNDLADYEDAALMTKKVQAAYSVFVTSDEDGRPGPDDYEDEDDRQEQIRPGMIEYLKGGTDVHFPQPPSTSDLPDFIKSNLRGTAAGLGVTYEMLTGDLRGVNYSSGRQGELRFQRSIASWQQNMLIPQLCDPVGRWFTAAVLIVKPQISRSVKVDWRAPHREMIDLGVEVKAKRDGIRTGLMTLSDQIRAMGKDPDRHFEELAKDKKRLDELGLFLDCDPRKVSLAGVTNARPDGTENPD